MIRLVALGVAFGIPLSALAVMSPANLRCEYLVNPMGIDETKPRLSWVLESNVRGDRQTGYQIRVASTPEALKRGKGDLWDTGRVASDATVHIEYAGKPLTSRQQAWWTVTTWDKDGKPVTSRPATWEMGLLAKSDWKAGWIGKSRLP
ncbi:alpha-L-rhamnosidase, partial [bacterium]